MSDPFSAKNDAMYGLDYLTALDELGYIDKRVLLQHVRIDHDEEAFSTVTITCSMRPSDLKALADYVAPKD